EQLHLRYTPSKGLFGGCFPFMCARPKNKGPFFAFQRGVSFLCSLVHTNLGNVIKKGGGNGPCEALATLVPREGATFYPRPGLVHGPLELALIGGRITKKYPKYLPFFS